MISTLSDESNEKLFHLIHNVLGLNGHALTIMPDKEVLAIFNKLAFQHRRSIGVFEFSYSYSSERTWIDVIESELANMELLT